VPHSTVQRQVIVLAGLLATACIEPQIDQPDAGGYFNFLDAAGMILPPPSPIIDQVPLRQPYRTITIRGSAVGRRVILEGGSNPISGAIVPDGTFCIDTAVPSPGIYDFRIFAQDERGVISENPTEISITFDPDSAAIPNAQTCGGSDPAGCPSQTEICGNGKDDDCNNLIDENDPACANCVDDALEPNNTANAPRIEEGRYDNLRICPNDPDYYGVFLKNEETLNAKIFFSHSFGNIDMQLLSPSGEDVLKRSVSTDDDELLSYTSSASAEYKLFIYSDEGANNPYSLEATVN
jgi:hypothetical protein